MIHTSFVWNACYQFKTWMYSIDLSNHNWQHKSFFLTYSFQWRTCLIIFQSCFIKYFINDSNMGFITHPSFQHRCVRWILFAWLQEPKHLVLAHWSGPLNSTENTIYTIGKKFGPTRHFSYKMLLFAVVVNALIIWLAWWNFTCWLCIA